MVISLRLLNLNYDGHNLSKKGKNDLTNSTRISESMQKKKKMIIFMLHLLEGIVRYVCEIKACSSAFKNWHWLCFKNDKKKKMYFWYFKFLEVALNFESFKDLVIHSLVLKRNL